MRAIRAIWPALRLKMDAGGFVVVKDFGGQVHGGVPSPPLSTIDVVPSSI
jgi:hypothetical protein